MKVVPSTGTEESLDEIRKFFGSPNSAPFSIEAKTVLSGWYSGEGCPVLRCGIEGNCFEVSRRASPDLVDGFGSEELASSRFEIELLSSEECSLFQRF